MLARSALLLTTAALTQAAVWQPAVGTSWQIILSAVIKISSTSPSVSPNVAVFDIDMFDNNSTNVIASLHKLGKKVICYYSAGTYENWRPDASQFPASAKGQAMDGWPGEYWINTNDATVRTIMKNRIKLAAQMGCDGVDPDNVDAYNNGGGGFSLTQKDAANYVQYLATTAASYNLASGLKNALEIIPTVSSYVQFAVNEECAFYNECSAYSTFIKTKPVFNIEYWDDKQWKTNPCSEMNKPTGFSTLIKYRNLDGRVTYCDGTAYTTSTV